MKTFFNTDKTQICLYPAVVVQLSTNNYNAHKGIFIGWGIWVFGIIWE